MVYIKSFLVGLGAAVAVVLLAVLGFIGWGWWMAQRVARTEGEGAVGYDVNTPWITIPAPILLAVVFGVGFWWEFRRARRGRPAR